MEVEERLQIRLAALEKAADIEGQRAGHDQEDHDEDVGERGREIADQLAAEHDTDGAHGQLLPEAVTRI